MFAQTAFNTADAAKRLSCRDPTLKIILVSLHTESEVTKVVDCLLTHPDVASHVYLNDNQLTDETGAKLARYLAASTTVESLSLRNNRLGEVTYLALAAALRVNSSLRSLHLGPYPPPDKRRIDAAFVEALRLNPDRPAYSDWMLYSRHRRDLPRLKAAVEQLGHPSMQMLLAAINTTFD